MKRLGHLAPVLFQLLGHLAVNKALSPTRLHVIRAVENGCTSGCHHYSRFLDASHGCHRPRRHSSTLICLSNMSPSSGNSNSVDNRVRPFPNMPSRHFLSLAQSQLDLLASTLQFTVAERRSAGLKTCAKVQSMALYLPRENSNTGQLEFVPVVTWPPPGSQRIWIASDAMSKQAPSIPRTLSRLPGFTHAKSLLPRYPFAAHQELSSTSDDGDNDDLSCTASMSCGVGPVEDIRCQSIVRGTRKLADNDNSLGEVLSVALYRGSLTVGVLLVWPKNSNLSTSYDQQKSFWTKLNYKQVSNAAFGLSIALSMDMEGSHQQLSTTASTSSNSQCISTSTAARYVGTATNSHQPSPNSIDGEAVATNINNILEQSNDSLYAYTSAQAYRDLVHAQLAQSEHLRRALSDNLHQVKNPLQALRAFGKLLQRKLILDEPLASSSSDGLNSITSLRQLADRMMIQTDRVIELLQPMENLVDQLERSTISAAPQQYLYLPAGSNGNSTATIYYLNSANGGEDEEKSSTSALQYLYLLGSNGNSTPTIHYLSPAKYSNNSESELDSSSPPTMITRQKLTRVDKNVNDVDLFFESFENQSFEHSSELTFQGVGTANNNIHLSSSSIQLKTFDNGGVIMDRIPKPSEIIPPAIILPDVNIQMSYISDVIEPILLSSAVVAADRNVKFEVIKLDEDDLPGVKICPSSLQEALSNVIENAIKYVVLNKTLIDSESGVSLFTSSNPYPHVRVSVVRNPETAYPIGVSIIVEDNGPGIPSSEREAVFRRGFRGSNAKDILSGNGLGLDISRSMLSRFGGTLEVLENGPKHLNGTVMRIMIFR